MILCIRATTHMVQYYKPVNLLLASNLQKVIHNARDEKYRIWRGNGNQVRSAYKIEKLNTALSG